MIIQELIKMKEKWIAEMETIDDSYPGNACKIFIKACIDDVERLIDDIERQMSLIDLTDTEWVKK